MKEESLEFVTLEDVVRYLEEHYPDKMILEKKDDFDMGVLVGEQRLANELLFRIKGE